MLFVRFSLVVLCILLALPARNAWAGIAAHGSRIEVYSDNDHFHFQPEYALRHGDTGFGVTMQYPKDVLIRVFDERHDRFQGFGPNGDQALSVDESVHQNVTAVLGKAKRLNVGGYEERMLCYTSTRPGDDTVALFTLTHCPDDCTRVMEIQVRAKKREVRVLDKCAATPGVHVDIATQSGLRVGLTRAQVQAILGPPQAQRGDKWLYAASVSVKFSEEEYARRGLPKPPVITPDYPFAENFNKYIVVWFKDDRVSAFRVNMDWVL